MTRRALAVCSAISGIGLLVGCGAGGLSVGSTSPLSPNSSANSSTAATKDGAPGAGIFGRVVDSTSQPVSNAVVELRSTDDQLLLPAIHTDENGEFEFLLSDEDYVEDVHLYFRPQQRPETNALVQVPRGANVDLLVTLGDDGGATVTPVLQAPRNAYQFGRAAHDPYALEVDSHGHSAPFILSVDGRFDPNRFDLHLIYREVGDDWTVASVALRAVAPTAVELAFEELNEIHGQRLEVRAISTRAGSLRDGEDFHLPNRPFGSDFVISPEPIFVVPITTRDQRLDNGGFRNNAVAAPGRDGELEIAAGDAQTLGITAGDQVTLSANGQQVRVTVVISTDPIFGLVTYRVGADDARRLGLHLGAEFAGNQIRVIPPGGAPGPGNAGGQGNGPDEEDRRV